MEFKKPVVSYAEEKSNRSVASHYGVEPEKVREWKKDLEKISVTQARRQARRQRLEGGGRKCNDEELEDELVHWCSLVASRDWCEKFMRRHGLYHR